MLLTNRTTASLTSAYALVIALLLFTPAVNAEETASRPNVIVIMADDLGYGDTSVYDGWVKTPHLERLASGGLTFTDFHSNSSVCSPTRAGFLTGRYQQRVGIVDVLARHLDTPALDPSELTIPRLMTRGGYRTALFGKWHLGMDSRSNPIHHGFDEFRGYLDGYVDYHVHKNSWHNGLEKEDQPGYSTHVITRNAVQFIEMNKARPFFLLVAHEAVHLPFQTPDDTPENRKPIPRSERWSRERIRPKYKIMLEEMDRGVGEILDAVNQAGMADRTLIFFLSDNGAIGAGSNKPFRGGKFSHYEGGHRVPAIAWWPGKIKPGTRTDELTMGSDLLPTFMELANIDIPKGRKLDGVSLRRLLLDGDALPKRQVFFGYEPKLGTAMRDGHWKMIVKARKVELYDLSKDIGERTNLADDHPERAEAMKTAIESWKKDTAWPGATTAVRTLIVGGGASHDFSRWFQKADAATLARDELARVRYTENTRKVLPALRELDVLYLCNNKPLPAPELRQGIFDFVASGHGLLLGHSALWYNWKDWPEYNLELVGGGARRHDRFGEFSVTVNSPGHPVMTGVPGTFEIDDELYHFVKDPKGQPIEVLATGKSPRDGRTFPVVWVRRHVRGRIVCVTLGHDGRAHDHPAYKAILRNGVRWAARRSR